MVICQNHTPERAAASTASCGFGLKSTANRSRQIVGKSKDEKQNEAQATDDKWMMYIFDLIKTYDKIKL